MFDPLAARAGGAWESPVRHLIIDDAARRADVGNRRSR